MSEGSIVRQLAPYLNLGTQLAASVLILGGAGWFADKYLNTAPWLLVIGLCLGSTIGLIQFLRTVSQLSKRDKESR